MQQPDAAGESDLHQNVLAYELLVRVAARAQVTIAFSFDSCAIHKHSANMQLSAVSLVVNLDMQV